MVWLLRQKIPLLKIVHLLGKNCDCCIINRVFKQKKEVSVYGNCSRFFPKQILQHKKTLLFLWFLWQLCLMYKSVVSSLLPI